MTATRIIYFVTTVALAVIAALSLQIYRSAERDAIESYSSQQLVITGAVAAAIQSEIDALSIQVRQFATLPSVQTPTPGFTGQRVEAAFGANPKGLVQQVARIDASGRAFYWSMDGTLTTETGDLRPDPVTWRLLSDRANKDVTLLAPVWWEAGPPVDRRALIVPIWRTSPSLEIPEPPDDFNGALALVIDAQELAALYLAGVAADLAEGTQLMVMGTGGPSIQVNADGAEVVGATTPAHTPSSPQGTAIVDDTTGRAVHAWSTFSAANNTWRVETSAPYQRITSRVRRSAVSQLTVTTAMMLALPFAAWLLLRREHRVKEEQRSLQAQLAGAQKMDALGRLAGGVAHDFNNMLTAILGYATLILEEAKPGTTVHEHAQQVQRASERAAELTRQLLAFGRRQVLQAESLDLGALVAELLPLLRRLIGERVSVVPDVEPGLWQVAADPIQLEQAVINLAINARDAMPEGGTLYLGLRNRSLPDGERREHYMVRPSDYVEVIVRDTGIGMDEATRQRMFEPFFTTKPKGKGTGLGLPSVYGFLKQSGGYIAVTSAPGTGTTVELLLPRARALAEPHHDAPALAHPRSGGRSGGVTVLVVEDEGAVRSLTTAILTRHGYRVLAAANAAAALELLKASPTPDLLITDVVMPGMQGPALARELRQRMPSLPIVLMSGYAADEVTDELLRDAVLLPKPFSSALLLETVRSALGDGAAQDANRIG